MKYVVCGLLCASLSLSRVAAQQVVPPLKKEFLDDKFKVLPSAEGAKYRRETEYRDSTAGEVRDYYLSGQLQSREQFGHIGQHRPHGVSEYFAENGVLLSHFEYDQGHRTGQLLLFYPDGKPKRRARYTEAFTSTGECFAPDGTPVPFFEFEVMPRYSEGDGGQQAIVQAIARNFRYPKDARRHGVEGRVFVKFVVSDAGRVEDTEVVQSLDPSIDAEAITAVQQLRRFAPGQQDGKPVRVSFTVPITLRLQ